jgi:hypothetical protein
MLLAALTAESGRPAEHRILETRLVVRRSTAPPQVQGQEVVQGRRSA